MGLGVLLGFFLVSVVFGTLETIRGNSPGAYRAIFESKINEVAEKESTIQRLNLIVAQRDATIKEINDTIAAKKAAIDAVDALVVERNITINERDATIVAKDATIATLNATTAERDATIVTRNTTIAERDATIVERDRTVVEQDQSIREFRLQVNNLGQQLRVIRRTLEDRERSIDRQGRRINFLIQENADLRDQREQLDPGQQQPGAEILEGLEGRAAELGLRLNASRRDLRNARRAIRDLESRLERRERIIQFLNQQVAEHTVNDLKVDTDHDRLIAGSTRPQTPAAATDTELNTSGPIPNLQVRRLVAGLQQVLHLLGGCPHAQDHREQLDGLEVLVEHMRDMVEQLNDSMFEELAQLVLDVMGHLGVKQ